MAAPLVATTPCSTLTAQGNFVRVLIPSVRPLSSSSRRLRAQPPQAAAAVARISRERGF
jgi:hypothetical protein